MRATRCGVKEMSECERVHASTTAPHAWSLGICLSVLGVVFVEIINS